MENIFTKFQEAIDSHQQITIVTHINPDADTLGSGLGLYGYLLGLGKQVEIVNKNKELPLNLDFLRYYPKIKNKIDYERSLIISCDCGSVDRLGFDVNDRDIINIDHHATNSRFGTLDIVNESAVSTSEVVFSLLENEALSRDDMTALYVALISDTRWFSTDNVTKNTFEIASKMVSYGLDLPNINRNMSKRKSLSSIRILARALTDLELVANGRIAVIRVRQSDMKVTGAKQKDIDSIVDYGISLATVEIALLLLEKEDSVKVSIRSKSADVSALALAYGGGGHKKAAGFEISCSDMDTLADELRDKIITGELIC